MKKHQHDRKKVKSLTNAQMRQVKGGYRVLPGTVHGSVTIRWDEIDLRFDDNEVGRNNSIPSGGITSRPTPSSGNLFDPKADKLL